jgi:hypothetical protein
MFVLPVAVSGRNPGSGSFDRSLFTAANFRSYLTERMTKSMYAIGHCLKLSLAPS